MKTHEDVYTTPLGTEFRFRFAFKDGNYEIEILEQPSYGERSDDLHTTHRIITDTGHKVCWTGPMPTLPGERTGAGVS